MEAESRTGFHVHEECEMEKKLEIKSSCLFLLVKSDMSFQETGEKSEEKLTKHVITRKRVYWNKHIVSISVNVQESSSTSSYFILRRAAERLKQND